MVVWHDIDTPLFREEAATTPDYRNRKSQSYTLDYVPMNINPKHLSDSKADSSTNLSKQTESHDSHVYLNGLYL